nr:MAG: 3'(2'),5'-bisphosphate nucleotidase CysQ [Hyphomicrobiales bacterium]
MSKNLSPLARQLAEIAVEAGALILRHYGQDTKVRQKRDHSPVTLADEEAEALIVERLGQCFPKLPIIAEEAVTRGEIPEIGERFFLVDPLDGTKEFLAHNGEFTVNIALIEANMPLCGVVVAPALQRIYLGDVGERAAFEATLSNSSDLDLGSAKEIHARKMPESGLIAMVSRSHRDAKTEEYLAHFPTAEMKGAGSSLKFCLIAAGEADLYPRHGRTMEWDIAAGHAVLLAAGGNVTQLDGTPFFYGKVAQGFANPYFVARGRE